MATADLSAIEIVFEDRPDGVYLTSPDVPGLHLFGATREAAAADLVPALKALFRANRGLEVEVIPAADWANPPQPQPPARARYILERAAA